MEYVILNKNKKSKECLSACILTVEKYLNANNTYNTMSKFIPTLRNTSVNTLIALRRSPEHHALIFTFDQPTLIYINMLVLLSLVTRFSLKKAICKCIYARTQESDPIIAATVVKLLLQ